jgi:hypothetical protein
VDPVAVVIRLARFETVRAHGSHEVLPAGEPAQNRAPRAETGGREIASQPARLEKLADAVGARVPLAELKKLTFDSDQQSIRALPLGHLDEELPSLGDRVGANEAEAVCPIGRFLDVTPPVVRHHAIHQRVHERLGTGSAGANCDHLDSGAHGSLW